MIRYECDKCGTKLEANAPHRYIVKLEVYAAAGHIDLSAQNEKTDLGQLIADLAAADPDEIEDQTYRCLRFDVCEACRRALLKKPLG